MMCLMKLPGLSLRRLETHGLGTIFRPRDLAGLGVPFRHLQQYVAEGAVEQLGPGLYRLAGAASDESEALAMVSVAVPGAIVCLLSALRFHLIGSQSPHEVWIAIDRKARRPARPPVKTRVVRFSGAMLTCGIDEHDVLGVPVRVTSPARTVVDCFRYRNKFGLDIAIEALREVVRTRKAKMDEILRTAETCRARTVVTPYLEALAT